MPGTFLAAWTVETRLGRKYTTSIGFSLCGVLTFVYILNMPYIVILCLSSLSWFFLYIGYSGMATIVPELYPADVRGVASGISDFSTRIGNLLANLVIGALLSADLFVLAIIITGVGIILRGLTAGLLPETRGRDKDAHLSSPLKETRFAHK